MLCYLPRKTGTVLRSESNRSSASLTSGDRNKLKKSLFFSLKRYPNKSNLKMNWSLLTAIRFHKAKFMSFNLASFRLLEAGLRIRIHFIRIRIQHFRLNTDPDPDPIRIQGFNNQKLEKNFSLKENYIFFGSKTTIYLSLGLHKERPSYRRSLQIKTWTFNNFSTFVGHFCPPGSGSGSATQLRSVQKKINKHIRKGIFLPWENALRMQTTLKHGKSIKRQSDEIVFFLRLYAQTFIFQTAFSVLFWIAELKGFSELSRNYRSKQKL